MSEQEEHVLFCAHCNHEFVSEKRDDVIAMFDFHMSMQHPEWRKLNPGQWVKIEEVGSRVVPWYEQWSDRYLGSTWRAIITNVISILACGVFLFFVMTNADERTLIWTGVFWIVSAIEARGRD